MPNDAVPYRLRLAPEECAGPKGFVRWRAALGDVFEVRAAPEEVQSFRGEIEVHASARYVLSASRHSPLSLFRSPGAAIHDRFAIRLSVCGSVAELAGDIGRCVDPGDIAILDLSQAAALRQSAPDGFTEGVTLWVAGANVRALADNDDSLYNVVLKGVSPEGAMIGSAMRSLIVAAPKLRLASFNALADGIVVMVAKIASAKIDRVRDASPSSAASFVLVRRFVDRNLRAPGLGPEMIRAEFGLSRPSLYRLFEPAGGVAAYIRKARLSRAFQDLAAGDDGGVGLIAARYGFRTINAFNRRFHEAYGMIPAQAREHARQGMPHPEFAIPAAPGNSLTRWLRRLAD